ncbi:MAG TPA: ABC-F family ATP-binding cassette domain-containing protein, partial [Thermomicrobiales bacterium]|nr:ABC-F family ATP-binding cassette domain-containing protein [Thermomicrobiales bacterium]
LRITYLPQEARFDSMRSIREEAQDAFADALRAGEHMREIEERLGHAGEDEFATLLEEYERLQSRFEMGGGYDIEHRTEEILVGLGFPESMFETPVHQLSGGQKTRVALAKALLADPDLLLLDEPTNHLDLVMLEWLETFLRTWGGACLIVSHDRYFLDRVTTRTMDLSFGRLEDYNAPYSRYLELRAERRSRQQKEYEEQQAFIARTEEFIRKYKAGQRAREAKGRQTRLDRVERIERPQDQAELGIRIQSSLRSGTNVLTSRPLTIGYKAQPQDVVLCKTKDLLIERGDRIGLVGPNGSGKTTLLKTLVREIPTLKGTFETGVNVKVGYYAQGHEQLPMDGSPLSVVLGAQPMGEESARNYLGRFLFSDDDVYKPVSGLSGGERSRLALSVLLLQNANFLILDEPTNHLDIAARETLESLLGSFDGTVLFVSHDRFFTDRIATKIWAVEDGQVHPYLGNYTDYQRVLGRRNEPAKSIEPEAPKVVVVEEPKATPVRRPSDGRVLKAITNTERDIARLEGKLNELSDALAIASIEADVPALARLGTAYEQVQ